MNFSAFPTDPTQRIKQLYCWVIINADDSEGIISVAQMPLITSKHAVAQDLMQKAAERMLALSQGSAKPGVRIELRTFSWDEPDGRG